MTNAHISQLMLSKKTQADMSMDNDHTPRELGIGIHLETQALVSNILYRNIETGLSLDTGVMLCP